jgi:signal peptidase II
LDYGATISVIGSFLQFTHIENPGMAFGIEFGALKPILSIFSIIASVFLFYLIGRSGNSKTLIKLGLALVTAGAAGNLIDRVFYGVFFDYAPLFYGMVVDFIQVDIPDINFLNIHYRYFPIFNVADSCVSVGVFILILMHKHLPSFDKKNNDENLLNDEIIANDTNITKDEMNNM